MNRLKNKLVLIVVTFFIIQFSSLLFSDNYIKSKGRIYYSSQKVGSSYWLGLANRVRNSSKLFGNVRIEDIQSLINNIKNCPECKNIKWNAKFKNKIYELINKAINKVDEKLHNCEAFQDYKNAKGINKDAVNDVEIYFADLPGALGAAPDKNIILIDSEFLEQIIKAVAQGIEDPEKVIVKVDEEYDLVETIGHEMMHLLGNIPGGVQECLAHCLQKLCFDESHKIPTNIINEGGGKWSSCEDLNVKAKIKLFGEDVLNAIDKGSEKPGCWCGQGDCDGNNTDHPNPDSPGGDNNDENFSYASSSLKNSGELKTEFYDYNNDNYEDINIYSYYPDCIVFNNFQMGHIDNLLRKIIDDRFLDYYGYNYFIHKNKVLIIPSGALFEKENDTTLKHVLEQYVSLGGTIIVFAQQFGSHIENVVPIPEGESLKVYGWRESQSCLWGSIFFNKENMHPVLSAMTNEKVSAPVDGYFSQVPSGSQIFLQRITNNEAALLMYPYGENGGHVILTSLYTDWGYAHSQASASELKLVRDLITFAKNPNLPISMYDLKTEPNPQIDLNVTVKNNTEDTEVTASKVKLKVYTPDRKTVLYETEQSVSLSAGAEAQIPINFTLPTLLSKDYGICHV